MEWMDNALCREIGPELFFPDAGGGSATARQICGKCSVKTQCLNFALSFPSMIGIWGGTTERQRRKLPKTYQEEQ
jgi:WhiB family transcriptional regulator, redox-sensing transcriptional regulator